MSYQHISHQSYPPPPPPPGGYNPTSAEIFDPPPPQLPRPPQIGGYNYPVAGGPPQLQSYGSYDYPGSYDSRRSPSSFLRACLAALCCCCVFEECCMNW